jgi:hypothetical protein
LWQDKTFPQDLHISVAKRQKSRICHPPPTFRKLPKVFITPRFRRRYSANFRRLASFLTGQGESSLGALASLCHKSVKFDQEAENQTAQTSG